LARKLRKEKLTKFEPPSVKIAGENSENISREDIACGWREYEIHFNNLLASANEEEFRLFIQKVEATHTECISFDSGYLELKITAADPPKISSKEISRINSINQQIETYRLFSQYMTEIKEARAKKQQESEAYLQIEKNENQNGKEELKKELKEKGNEDFEEKMEIKEETYNDENKGFDYGGIFDPEDLAEMTYPKF
jgi:hypothetical protein